MRKFDTLFLAAVVLSPMTGWRVDRVGPAEVLILLWCLLSIISIRGHLGGDRTGLFWGAFGLLLLISTVHGLAVTPAESALSDVIIWGFFAFVSVTSVAVLRRRNLFEIDRLLSWIGTASAIWFGVLYLYGLGVSHTLLGAPLWYYRVRFTGGADNPHQLSVLMAAAAFICLRSAVRAPALTRKCFHLTTMAIALFLGFATASSTLILAVAVAGAFAAIHYAVSLPRAASMRATALALVFVGIVVGASTQWKSLVELFNAFLDSDDNGWGRFEIWRSFDRIAESTTLIGLGPGTHAKGGVLEFHNMYLDIAAMTGLFGLAAFVIYSVWLLRTLTIDWSLITIAVPLYVYGISGFAARRLSFWLLLAILLALALTLRELPTDDRQRYLATRSTRSATTPEPRSRA